MGLAGKERRGLEHADHRRRPAVQRERGPDDGRIAANEEASAGPWDATLVVPGMPNAHSHAFQRALAGVRESTANDSFWSWRETMYRIANALVRSGIEPGERVAVLAKNCIEYVLFYYAASKTGAVPVPFR